MSSDAEGYYRNDSHWDVFDAPMAYREARERQDSRWEVIDTTKKSNRDKAWENADQSTSQKSRTKWDLRTDADKNIKLVKIEANCDTSAADSEGNAKEEDAEEEEKEEPIDAQVREMMRLIDNKNNGTVTFPEFLETINLKVMQDAASQSVIGKMLSGTEWKLARLEQKVPRN